MMMVRKAADRAGGTKEWLLHPEEEEEEEAIRPFYESPTFGIVRCCCSTHVHCGHQNHESQKYHQQPHDGEADRREVAPCAEMETSRANVGHVASHRPRLPVDSALFARLVGAAPQQQPAHAPCIAWHKWQEQEMLHRCGLRVGEVPTGLLEWTGCFDLGAFDATACLPKACKNGVVDSQEGPSSAAFRPSRRHTRTKPPRARGCRAC